MLLGLNYAGYNMIKVTVAMATFDNDPWVVYNWLNDNLPQESMCTDQRWVARTINASTPLEPSYMVIKFRDKQDAVWFSLKFQ